MLKIYMVIQHISFSAVKTPRPWVLRIAGLSSPGLTGAAEVPSRAGAMLGPGRRMERVAVGMKPSAQQWGERSEQLSVPMASLPTLLLILLYL